MFGHSKTPKEELPLISHKHTSDAASVNEGMKKSKGFNAPIIASKWIDLDPYWTVIYKKGKILNGRYYVIELSINEENFYILSFDIESSE